MTFQLKQDVY